MDQIQPQPDNKFAQLVMQQTQAPVQAPFFRPEFSFQKPFEQSPVPNFNLATPNQAFQMANTQPMETNFFSNIVHMNTEPFQPKENTFFGHNLPLKNEEPLENKLYYSNINEINKKDLDEFKSNEFTIGRIPNIPPARELC